MTNVALRYKLISLDEPLGARVQDFIMESQIHKAFESMLDLTWGHEQKKKKTQ